MKNQQLFIFLTLLLLSLLVRFNLGNLPFLTGKYIYWLFITLIGSVVFLFQNHNRKWELNQFDICILILFFGGLLNFVYLSNASVFNLKVWHFSAYLLLYIILRRSLCGKEKISEISKKIYYLLLLVATLNSAIAILQESKLLSSSNEYFQVTGLFFSPNHLALFLAIGILSLIELTQEVKSRLSKVLLFICFPILAYGLYLSKCRGAFVALIVAMLFNLNTSKREIRELIFSKKLLYASAIVSCFFIMIWNTNTFKSQSASGRMFIAKHSLIQLKDRLLTGYGFDSFSLQYNLTKADYFSVQRPWEETRNASYLYNANNDFLELGFELGMIWIAIFCIFIIMLFIKSKHNNITKACSSILLCIIIFAFTNTILPVPLFAVLGCIFTVVIINESQIKPVLSFKQNYFSAIITTIFIATFSSIIALRLNAEYKLKKIFNQEEIAGLKKTENYVTKIDANGEQLFMAGIIFMKNNNPEEGLRYLTNGFNQSGKPTLGKNLAKLFERMGNYDKAEEIYIYNKNVEPFRFNARIDLFNLYQKTNQRGKAREIAKEILYLPIKIPSKEIESFKEKAKNYLKN
ncbi:O-antigen ligase family protein [Flavobacterium sp. 2]|uniref:O-antigen ligase family protein n=1 Tax=Flavobacterium sp. 2 TaxID=308053 RepID=UPI003CF94F74